MRVLLRHTFAQADWVPAAVILNNYFIFSKLAKWFTLCLMGIGQSDAVRVLMAEGLPPFKRAST
jgi:hypothetical protein